MGSVFSGRYGRRSTRATVADCLALDVRLLGRKSLLAVGSCFTVSWTQRGETLDSVSVTVEVGRLILAGAYGRDRVRLKSTACGFGGRRWWLLCPRCGQRCCLLYQAGGWACRVCLRLAYPVQREGRYDRAERRGWRIIRRAEYDLGRKYGKPKWQRWRTFWRLFNDAETAAEHIDMRLVRMMATVRAVDERTTRPKRGRGRPTRPRTTGPKCGLPHT